MQKDGIRTGRLRGKTKEKVWSKASAKKKGSLGIATTRN
jgi:hypothetical protein